MKKIRIEEKEYADAYGKSLADANLVIAPIHTVISNTYYLVSPVVPGLSGLHPINISSYLQNEISTEVNLRDHAGLAAMGRSLMGVNLSFRLIDHTTNIYKVVERVSRYLRYVVKQARKAGAAIQVSLSYSMTPISVTELSSQGVVKLVEEMGLIETWKKSVFTISFVIVDEPEEYDDLDFACDAEFKKYLANKIDRSKLSPGRSTTINVFPRWYRGMQEIDTTIYNAIESGKVISGNQLIQSDRARIQLYGTADKLTQENVDRFLSDVVEKSENRRISPFTGLFYIHELSIVIKTLYRILPYEPAGIFVLHM